MPRTDENGKQLKALLDYLLDGEVDAKDIYETLGIPSSTYYRRVKDDDWLLLCGMLIYLLGYGSRALLILRKDPRSRRVATAYLAASGFGMLACVVRIVTACVPGLQAIENGTLVWLFACACGAGFALASAHSWRVKTKWFSSARR